MGFNRSPTRRQQHRKETGMVTVNQIMTRSIVQIEVGTSAVDAAKLMKARNIGSVFVTKADVIIGIVTEPDIVRKVVGTERLPYFIPVEEIMSSPVRGIDEHRPITEAADLMEQYGTRHLAVFQAGRIVGILSVRDLLHPVSIDEF
jgi:CBS domain-containing protein